MIVNTINNRTKNYKPIWFMRQAGRHLEEYNILRSKHSDFLSFCLNEDSIIKATLIPIKKYNLDAAIIFSDILIIPWLLGQEVRFIKNAGPKLSSIENDNNLLKNSIDLKKIKSINNAIKKIRQQLPLNIDLIGFAGAPWTLACYMVEGGGSKNFEKIRTLLWNDEAKLLKVIDKLIYSITDLLEFQFKAGVDLLMLFDTWSHMIPSKYWNQLAILPTQKIVKELRRRGVTCPIVGFPFKAGEKLIEYSYESQVDVVSIDWNTDLAWACSNINSSVVTQGNLDPISLSSKSFLKMSENVEKILEIVEDRIHIFNVGHGLTPNSKVENVNKVIEIVKKWNN